LHPTFRNQCTLISKRGKLSNERVSPNFLAMSWANRQQTQYTKVAFEALGDKWDVTEDGT
jgi:hypothetical protein